MRALAHLLAKEYGPQGIHVATVTVGGAVAPGTAFDPDDIAEQYWRLHTQPEAAWELEVDYRVSGLVRRTPILAFIAAILFFIAAANEGHLNHWGITIVLIVVGVVLACDRRVPAAGVDAERGTAYTLGT